MRALFSRDQLTRTETHISISQGSWRISTQCASKEGRVQEHKQDQELNAAKQTRPSVFKHCNISSHPWLLLPDAKQMLNSAWWWLLSSLTCKEFQFTFQSLIIGKKHGSIFLNIRNYFLRFWWKWFKNLSKEYPFTALSSCCYSLQHSFILTWESPYCFVITKCCIECFFDMSVKICGCL